MSSFVISSKVVDAGVRFHHQDDIGYGNDDDEATVMGVSSTLDAGDDTLTSSSSERNTTNRFYTDRNRSTTSYTTECTNDTTRISNITRRQTAKENRSFLLFIKILMKLIGEKDLNLFRKAQTIIRDYKQRKQRGEIESFVESICSPLKENVGLQYWNEARELLHSHKTPNMTSIIPLKPPEMISKAESSTLQSATIPSSSIRHRGLKEGPLSLITHKSKISNFESIMTSTNHNNIGDNKEMRTRKKRLWMIISIFMQYLERKHMRLYLKARSLVNECVERHRCSKYDEKYSNNSSLSGSIQSCLKDEIGIDHWRRAEKYVAKALLKHDNEDDDNTGKSKNNAMGSVERINHSTTIVKKRRRSSSDEVYNNDTKRLFFESR